MKIDLQSMTKDELCALVKEYGQPAYRGEQLFKWAQAGTPVESMTNLSKDFRAKLGEDCFVYTPKIERKLVSEIDGTVKYLFSLDDGQMIESVVMKYNHGNTICVSSQAGCRMGCTFCASTLNGLSRNLRPSEILGQIVAAQNDTKERISNIVMMGIGEPLDNYDNVIKFLHLVNEKDGLNIGMRHISLSTCGLVDKIIRLACENVPVTLSISFHAPSDTERKKLMPVANRWSIDELLSACKYFFEKTKRRISFEYTLIPDENDSENDAVMLARRLKNGLGKGIPIHVNLIRLNEVAERNYRKGTEKSVNFFCEKLNSLGINATVRRRLGPDINASCGQLRYEGTEKLEI
mgnify:CR=1 FL=1